MPFNLRPQSSLETQLDYVSDGLAGLTMLAELGVAGAPWKGECLAEWEAMRNELRNILEERGGERLMAQALDVRARILKAVWNKTLMDLSGATLQASARKTKAEPYASLFGNRSAGKISVLRPEAAILAATEILEKVRALGHPLLGLPASALEAATAKLANMLQKRDETRAKLNRHEPRRAHCAERIDRLIEKTEGEIRRSWPGDDDLVRAILSVDSGEKTKKPKHALEAE